MPGIVRLPDKCSGHGSGDHYWPPRASITGSMDVLEQNLPVERYSDTMDSHCCINHPQEVDCHSGEHRGVRSPLLCTANGLAIQIKGDPISCGSVCDECSEMSFVGGF